MAVTEMLSHAERERRSYIAAVLQWQREYGCDRATAVAKVTQILGIAPPPITIREWCKPVRRRSGRPAAGAITRAQNVAVLAVYYEREGVRPMQAIKQAQFALGPHKALSKSKALEAVRWARAVLTGGSSAETELHARAAWQALGRHGIDPVVLTKNHGRGPGRPRKSRFKGTNYRGI